MSYEDWEVNCSDDEKYDVKLRDNGEWEPEPTQILELLEKLDGSEEGLLTLNWVCPGRRPPTPDMNENETTEKMRLGDDGGEHKSDERDEYFDFEIDKGQLRLRPTGDVGPRGSAKKKTTSLDAILSNMARHRRMDLLDQDPDAM